VSLRNLVIIWLWSLLFIRLSSSSLDNCESFELLDLNFKCFQMAYPSTALNVTVFWLRL
jgi:hypothetical protein